MMSRQAIYFILRVLVALALVAFVVSRIRLQDQGAKL